MTRQTTGRMTGPLTGPRRRPAQRHWTVDGTRPARVLTGLQLRAGVAALAVLTMAVAVLPGGGSGLRLVSTAVGVALVVGMVVSPTSPLPTMFVLAVALVMLDAGPSPWLALPVGALLHAVHVGVAWCAVVQVDGQVEPAALTPSLRRWGLTQLLCLPAAAVVLVLAGSPGLPVAGWVAAVSGAVVVCAGVLVALLSLWTVRRGGRSEPRG